MANPIVTFTMADGKVMKAELYPEVAPNTVNKIIDSYRCESILYISCKPTSLARDILVFMNAGYKVKKIQCVDMFPNTVHVETVTLLVRKP